MPGSDKLELKTSAHNCYRPQLTHHAPLRNGLPNPQLPHTPADASTVLNRPSPRTRPLYLVHKTRCNHKLFRLAIQGHGRRYNIQDPRLLPLQEQARVQQQPGVPILHGRDNGCVDGCGGEGYSARYVKFAEGGYSPGRCKRVSIDREWDLGFNC